MKKEAVDLDKVKALVEKATTLKLALDNANKQLDSVNAKCDSLSQSLKQQETTSNKAMDELKSTHASALSTVKQDLAAQLASQSDTYTAEKEQLINDYEAQLNKMREELTYLRHQNDAFVNRVKGVAS